MWSLGPLTKVDPSLLSFSFRLGPNSNPSLYFSGGWQEFCKTKEFL